MTQPAPPEPPAAPSDATTRAIQRVRDLHAAGPDGNCRECGKPWPCPTTDAVDGPDEDDITQAMNELRTILAAAEQQPPADLGAFRRRIRQAIGDPPNPPPPPPPPTGGGAGGGIRQEPPLDQNHRGR